MKTNTLLVSCLVLGSSAAAMADSSFGLQARWSVNAGYHASVGPVVRDHRTASNPWTHGRGERFDDERYPGRVEDRGDIRYVPPAPALPAVTGPTWDCHNWDPTVDVSSVCAAYAVGHPGAVPETTGAGILLGVRDAAIPDHQYITVGAGRSFYKLVIQGNDCAPEIDRVAIKFTDGSVQVVNAYQRLREGRSMSINLDGGRREINQIVFYTPSGATGSYAVFAR